MTQKKLFCWLLLAFSLVSSNLYAQNNSLEVIRKQFNRPGNVYKPGVYWYFMDGNMSAETIKKDLDAMKEAGIANALFLEVNVGVPRGTVEFLSEKWFSLLKYAISEAKQDGINISLAIGPGWQGSGGPWIKPRQSTQLLEASETIVSSEDKIPVMLPLAPPNIPYFGDDGLTLAMQKERDEYYQNIAVLAFPKTADDNRLPKYSEKALYYRGPYSSDTVKAFVSLPDANEKLLKAIPASQVIDITNKMSKDGKLDWRPPFGKWVVMRFVSRNNGAITRPSPVPGVGFESDKLDAVAIRLHLDQYVGKLLHQLGNEINNKPYGLKALHMDSWEVSSQNWTPEFRKQFLLKRGYDPLKYLPVYYGHVIGSAEKSERFLWDMRKTAQDLMFQNHVSIIRDYAHKHGLKLSIEPYDLNQTSDLDYGSFADIPMGEFWSKDFDFNTSYSVVEATSIAHILGKSVVQSEAFTAYKDEGWRQYPGSMKNQGDWAFAAGITKFFFHTYENQFLPDSLKPGATMGPFGIHWDRSQTWWPMVGAYHTYLTRCQYLLQQGRTVADILFLTPEGNPNVFVPPASALTRDTIGDRKGFSFDGCTGQQLMHAKVVGHTIQFPGGANYKIMILPAFKTMTPELLAKIECLVKDGAAVVGPRPLKSPSLVNYPACDRAVRNLSEKIWGVDQNINRITFRRYGKGTIISGGAADTLDGKLYPYYETIASLLKSYHFTEDFVADAAVRYTHRTSNDWDIYFVSNTTNQMINFDARFRTNKGAPELWYPNSGKFKQMYHYTHDGARTKVPLNLNAYESCFVVFSMKNKWHPLPRKTQYNLRSLIDLNHDWKVAFDVKWGGPAHAEFKDLKDWTLIDNDGIKYYSGTASYSKIFEFKGNCKHELGSHLYIDLGVVKNIARVTVNGKDLGVVWTAPWRVDVTNVLKKGNNEVKIDVVNLWANRLIGDEKFPSDGPKDGKWPTWLLNNQPRPGKRFTFTTTKQYSANSPLQSSGLIGPVELTEESEIRN